MWSITVNHTLVIGTVLECTVTSRQTTCAILAAKNTSSSSWINSKSTKTSTSQHTAQIIACASLACTKHNPSTCSATACQTAAHRSASRSAPSKMAGKADLRIVELRLMPTRTRWRQRSSRLLRKVSLKPTGLISIGAPAARVQPGLFYMHCIQALS